MVLSKSREEAEAALAEIRQWTADNGLRLSPMKTHLGDCREPEEGFDFLGYRFEAGRRWVRKKSLARFKDSIRAKTGRMRGVSLARVIADLNPLLRGWFGYFKHATRSTFRALDQMLRRRLRAFLRKQEKRPGFGRCQADRQRWPNAFFAEAGCCSLLNEPGSKRDTPDEETTDWRAVCGKTARTVRRAGRVTFPTPISPT